jgi:UPF0288 family protein (methanogenesis marker protein 3)
MENTNTSTSNIYNKTLRDVSTEVFDVLKTKFTGDVLREMLDKLVAYQYVDEIYKIKQGRFIRWITTKGVLANGAIVADIKFLDNGTHVLCKNSRGGFIQIKFDHSILFQKLTPDENLILSANDLVSTD